MKYQGNHTWWFQTLPSCKNICLKFAVKFRESSPPPFRESSHPNISMKQPSMVLSCGSSGKKGRGTSSWLIVQKDLPTPQTKHQALGATCVSYSDFLFLQSVNISHEKGCTSEMFFAPAKEMYSLHIWNI